MRRIFALTENQRMLLKLGGIPAGSWALFNAVLEAEAVAPERHGRSHGSPAP